MNKKLLNILLVLSLPSSLAFARPRPHVVAAAATPPNVQVTIDGMSGTGCPQGSARAALSPDSSVVSVLFDQLNTEINPTDAVKSMKKTCQIRLRVWFAGKYRVAIVGSDIRAFAGVPEGGRSVIDIQHYSPFTSNPKVIQKMNLKRILQGPANEDLFLQSRFADVPMWSYCGSQLGGRGFNLMNMNLTIDSTNNSESESLIASIDSADLDANAALQYHLLWRYDSRNCP